MNDLASPLDLDGELRRALARRLDGIAAQQTSPAVERLIAGYRGDAGAPVLRDEADAVAYAAYRMPATFQAVRAALAAFRERAGEWTPARHLDVGGGTGAATWAVADSWPDGGHTTTVLDRSQPALDLGRALAAAAPHPALRSARWQRQALGTAPALPDADLVTVSYLLGELGPADRESVIAQAARAGQAVVVTEPGTPAGYRRILDTRRQLTESGFTVLAPCPHAGACPLTGDDWCHFAARVSRSTLHRQVKGGRLAYEDEKFSYVAAVREPAGAAPAAARVIRHPHTRKGLVELDLCADDGATRRENVSKRHGSLYRAARDTVWGSAWPPAP